MKSAPPVNALSKGKRIRGELINDAVQEIIHNLEQFEY
jgi:hypothetical protein